ncbi:MAG: hypothetical protein S4CHLAM2_14240 [Chlamydiales bacterium]|nr:hypothetical protein [Chlamydiales bacterium]
MRILLFLLAVVPSLLCAETCQYYEGDPCQTDCDNAFGFSVYGEWLYWNVRRNNLDYAMPFNDAPPVTSFGKVSRISPQYENGFRVGLQKSFDCNDIEVRYTYYRNRELDSNFVTGGLQGATRTIAPFTEVDVDQVDFARAEWKLDYDVADVWLKHTFCLSRLWEGHFFGGFTWAKLDQQLDTFYIDVSASDFDRIRETRDMNAYGLSIGVGGRCPLLGCFDLFGNFWYNALIGDVDRSMIYDTSADGGVTIVRHADLRDDGCEFVSVLNVCFGLEYRYSLCWCWLRDLSLAVGYEFHHWIGMSDFYEFQTEVGTGGTDALTVLRRTGDLELDGLFVRVGLTF